jgi:hypothetical protein
VSPYMRRMLSVAGAALGLHISLFYTTCLMDTANWRSASVGFLVMVMTFRIFCASKWQASRSLPLL